MTAAKGTETAESEKTQSLLACAGGAGLGKAAERQRGLRASRVLLLLACAGLISLLGCPLHIGKSLPMRLSRFYTPLPAEPVLSGNMVPVHDPSIVRREDGTYVVFDTDIPFLASEHFIEERCSRNLVTWHGCGYVFEQMPAWVRRGYPKVTGLWAPDISFFHGMYHLYYAVSTLGAQHSAIALATNVTLDPRDPRYRWQDHGPVLTSSPGDDFNAIDPNVFVEHTAAGAESHVWLNYGSFWGGLFQQEVDLQTGSLANHRRYHLAEQPASRMGALEGAAMIRHGDWFYLFASVGICCAIPIEKDTYQQIVGRGRSVHGPFVAQDGGALLRGAGTVVLTGDAHWIGPGGGSLWQSPDGKDSLFTFHALHRRENGALDLWVERVTWHGRLAGAACCAVAGHAACNLGRTLARSELKR